MISCSVQSKSAKDQFTADELKLLQGEAEKIRDIENKLTMIEEKYPEAAQKSTDGAMSVPAGKRHDHAAR